MNGTATDISRVVDVDPASLITLTATKQGSKAGEERAAKQADEGPQSGPGSDLGGGISGFLSSYLGFLCILLHFGIDLVDASFGLGLSQASTLSDQLRQVGTVISRQSTIVGYGTGNDATGNCRGSVVYYRRGLRCGTGCRCNSPLGQHRSCQLLRSQR